MKRIFLTAIIPDWFYAGRTIRKARVSSFFSNKKLLQPPIRRAAHSDRTAWIMAEHSKLAYERDLKKLRQYLKAGGFQLVQTFDRNETQAYLARCKDYMVLAFRGTEPQQLRDIWTDLKFTPFKKERCVMHEGFYEAYRDIEKELVGAVRKINLPLYVTGHSLGGALALIAVMYLPDMDWTAACYTFGGPKVGDDDFTDGLFKVPVYRTVNSSDIVPSLPPFWLALFGVNYQHAGDMRYLTRRGDMVIGIRGYLLYVWELAKSMLPFWWSRLVEDHSMDDYRHKLLRVASDKK